MDDFITDTVKILSMGLEQRDYVVRYVGEKDEVCKITVNAIGVVDAGRQARELLGIEVQLLGIRWAGETEGKYYPSNMG